MADHELEASFKPKPKKEKKKDARAKKYRDRIIRRAALRSGMRELADEQSKNLTIDETTLWLKQLQSMSRELNPRKERVCADDRLMVLT
ncbi:hypothetical protein Neosp_008539 [[Neocosmospora] mangrovei]